MPRPSCRAEAHHVEDRGRRENGVGTRENTHLDLAGGDLSEGILDLVGEGVRAGLVLVGDVAERPGRLAADVAKLVAERPDEHDRVTIGIDAVQREVDGYRAALEDSRRHRAG